VTAGGGVVIVSVVSAGGCVPVGTELVVGVGVVGTLVAGLVTVGVVVVGGAVVIVGGDVVVVGGSTTGGGVVVVVVVDGIDGEVCVTVRPGAVFTVVVSAGSVDVGVVGVVAIGPVGVVVAAGVDVVGVGAVFSFDAASSLSLGAVAAWLWCAATTVDGASECGTVGAAGGAGADEDSVGGGVTCATALEVGCAWR
jgi:hypothetical protein